MLKRVCVVGAGPAGFYTTQYLLRHYPNCRIDILEKLPAPFGLIRYGVAPDHPEVKNVIHTFDKILQDQRVRLLGNVSLGKDVQLSSIRKIYNAVVIATGADADKTLQMDNVIPARRLVDWYNGMVDSPRFDFKGVNTVTVIGHGNVAIDIARILLTPVTRLKKFDIPQAVLENLASNKIETVNLIGRRGPLQVSFTIAELRELIRGCNTHVEPLSELLDCDLDALPRVSRRLTKLLKDTALKPPSHPQCFIKFFKSPHSVTYAENGLVSGMYFSKTTMLNSGTLVVKTDEEIWQPAQMLISSLGYFANNSLKELPWNSEKGTFYHDLGCITDKGGVCLPGLFCSGWIKRGPKGVIASTLHDAQETGQSIVEYLNSDVRSANEADLSKIIRETSIVSYGDWKRIDEYEVKRGKKLGKSREKFLATNEMIELSRRIIN